MIAIDQGEGKEQINNNKWRKGYGRGDERRKKWRWKKETRGNPELGSEEYSTVEHSRAEHSRAE